MIEQAVAQRFATPHPEDRPTGVGHCEACKQPIHSNAGLWVHSSTFADCDRHLEWVTRFE